MRRRILACAIATLCGCGWLLHAPPWPLSAQATFPDPNAGLAPELFGKVSPLIPMQSSEAVHMGLVWKRKSDSPKILFHSRFPEYRGIDMADPALIDLAIAKGGLTNSDAQNSRNNFNASLRDVLHGFDPFLALGMNRSADDSFQRLTYGGYLMRQGLSQSVPTRIRANRTMERQLLFNPFHPDAFKNFANDPKFHTALLDTADFARNRAAFEENGYSKGMFYNTYCNARVTLSDGRVCVFGGHDMQSNNGLYKVNVFNPETEEWVRRTEPCTRANWERDPFGRELFSRDASAQSYDDCDQRNQQSTQPSDPSDQKYARWYPSAAPLPNGWVLVIGGFDQDGTVAPDPLRAEKGRNNVSQSDTAFTASRVNIVVPEVYDPKTDRNIALENARMAFPLYPQMEIVQTGPGKEDWKVCTFNGEIDYGIETADEASPGYRDAHGVRTLGGARFGVGGGTTPFTKGNTWCLDVIGAMKDPDRNIAARNHWTLLDTASEVRPYCCPTASLIEIDRRGRTVSHRWFMISGQAAGGAPTDTIEVIDFAESDPKWRPAGKLAYPLTTRKAVVLPDGKVLLGHGLNRGLASVGDPVLDYERREGLRFHMYDPDTFAVTPLARTTVSRGLHGTATLLPDGSVFFAGENREALVRNNDPSFPLMSSYAGPLPAGDPDQGVPVGQIFYPAYLFKDGGTLAARPVVTKSPDKISFRGHFDITVDGDANQIASVALLRSDHNTHSFTGGDRHVKLAFELKDDDDDDEDDDDKRGRGDTRGHDDKRGHEDRRTLRVTAPASPAQAVPGVYMLVVVDSNGVPSVAKQVRIEPETRGRTTAFR